jgi:hypothetical protein
MRAASIARDRVVGGEELHRGAPCVDLVLDVPVVKEAPRDHGDTPDGVGGVHQVAPGVAVTGSTCPRTERLGVRARAERPDQVAATRSALLRIIGETDVTNT